MVSSNLERPPNKLKKLKKLSRLKVLRLKKRKMMLKNSLLQQELRKKKSKKKTTKLIQRHLNVNKLKRMLHLKKNQPKMIQLPLYHWQRKLKNHYKEFKRKILSQQNHSPTPLQVSLKYLGQLCYLWQVIGMKPLKQIRIKNLNLQNGKPH